MNDGLTLFVYAVAAAMSTSAWIIYVLYYTWNRMGGLTLIPKVPFLRVIMRITWAFCFLDLLLCLLFLGISLLRGYFGVGIVVEGAPEIVGLAVYVQYAIVIGLGTSPAVLLYTLTIAIEHAEDKLKAGKAII